MEVINPLSLLEVTMGDENHEDDDCVIIEDGQGIQNFENGGPFLKSVPQRMEVEVDPLYVAPSEVCNANKQSHMTTLWVTTNINNLSTTSLAEGGYRKKKYQNIYEVLNEELHCTICLDHVGCDIRVHPSAVEHPVLKVLICEKCAYAYRTVHFVLNEKGKELSCRWCGKVSYGAGPPLRTCQQCPFSFCELCLYNNCANYNEPRFPWTCFVCNLRALWSARATLWALHSLKTLLLSNPENALAKISGDISLCCKGKRKKKKDGNQTITSAPVPTIEPLNIESQFTPHFMNGSSEPIFNNEQPQANSIGSFSIVKCFPGSKEYKCIKSKAKPKPRAKPRSTKASILKQATCRKKSPQLSSNFKYNIEQQSSIPSLAISDLSTNITTESNLQNSCKKPHWLRTKIIGYISDFEQLRIKLEDIDKSLEDMENNVQIDEKIDSITTLLALHGDLLKNCRLNLINEWKERKARAVLENYKPKILDTNEVTKVNSLPSQTVRVTSTKKKRKSTKLTSRKKQTAKSRSHANNNQCNNNIMIVEEGKDHVIRDCFVKLQKLSIPLPIQDNCFIKLEKLDVSDQNIN